MNVTLGILAHVDAGKTTLSEQLLCRCGVLRACGRVDHGDTCLDYTAVERSRGITVFSAQADFFHGETHYFLLDTPGHADFRPETERCLAALDCAVLVISCTAGVQAGTEVLWRRLAERGIPTICFLNKLDCPGADPAAVLSQLEQRFGGAFCWLSQGLTDQAREQIALTDDQALEAYLAGEWTDEDCWTAARAAFSRRQLFPVFSGSALGGDGVDALLEGLDLLAASHYPENEAPRLLVCQVRRDGRGDRVALCKVLSGTLRPRQVFLGEKVQELRRYQGAKWTPLDHAKAGELAAVTGLQKPRAGDQITAEEWTKAPCPEPPLLVSAQAPDVPHTRLLEIFRTLEDEEPTLSVRWEEPLRQLKIAVAGEIQTQILQQSIQERFGIQVEFGPPQVVYQETVARPVLGCGHFEPLRHYAEVHLLLEPAPRGTGVQFASRCPTDFLALHWQRLIETHVLERRHPGALTGMPLTDVKVVLLAGRAHEKHTEGGDFRQAVYRAIRQALFHAENVLLEPYYRFTIEAEPTLAGRLRSDLTRLQALDVNMETVGAFTALTGRCPVSAMLPYARDLAAATRGRAAVQLEPDGYEPCRNQAEAVAAIGYDRERDEENPAGSIFCHHGAGHPVSWRDAPATMHIQLKHG